MIELSILVIGVSGCGKSTIVQLLERFYDVTHGQVVNFFFSSYLNIELWSELSFSTVSIFGNAMFNGFVHVSDSSVKNRFYSI
jgi:ABC-type polar amino acid transport system ATPase subunit